MEQMLTELGVIIGSVAAIMVIVKALLKDALPPLVAKIPYIPNFPEAEKVKYSFKVIAALIGIVLAFTVYKDISYVKWFDFVPAQDWVKYADHVIVGILAGLGEKAAADVWDFVWKTTGTYFGKKAPNA